MITEKLYINGKQDSFLKKKTPASEIRQICKLPTKYVSISFCRHLINAYSLPEHVLTYHYRYHGEPSPTRIRLSLFSVHETASSCNDSDACLRWIRPVIGGSHISAM